MKKTVVLKVWGYLAAGSGPAYVGLQTCDGVGQICTFEMGFYPSFSTDSIETSFKWSSTL